MGSQVILDLISSSFVFGTLLVMALRLNGSVTENLETYNGEVIVQDNMCDVVNMIQYDFRKIGYCLDPTQLPDPTKAIIYADTSSIKFYTDLSTAANPLRRRGPGYCVLLSRPDKRAFNDSKSERPDTLQGCEQCTPQRIESGSHKI